MSNKRIVNFTTCVRNSSIYDDRVIKLLIGFVPTEDECESLSMEQLRNTELATREKEHADEIYCLVTLANNDEALSITKESLIKLLSLIGCE